MERLAKAFVLAEAPSGKESLGNSWKDQARELAADRAHADYCAGCQASVESLVAAEMKFRKMMMSITSVPASVKTAECPPDQIWASVATGLITDRDAAPWLLHASECDPCAALLREATEDLALEATAEELAQIQGFATPEWRGQMARAMGATASRSAPQTDGWSTWLRRQLRVWRTSW